MRYSTPGVYINEIFAKPEPRLSTGVPVILGSSNSSQKESAKNKLFFLKSYQEFLQVDREENTDIYTRYAVRGFFQNDGKKCYVALSKKFDAFSVRDMLFQLDLPEDVDLICAPEIMRYPDYCADMQNAIIEYCERSGDKFAILDILPEQSIAEITKDRNKLNTAYAAMYYPWIRLKTDDGNMITIPPSGHIAGIFAAGDSEYGIHKAPANRVISDIYGVSTPVSREDAAAIAESNINCLKHNTISGDVNVWGARTLSNDVTWRYINVKRLFITLGRWCKSNMNDLLFETNTPELRSRVERTISAYLTQIYLHGGLKGKSPQDAFFVQCNDFNNSSEDMDAGNVVTDIGLAVTYPNEFIVVQLVHNYSNVSLSA